ncbi:ABC transporter substrate-binding protein [Clavibacter nebraskensis]|uniref:Peptide ABC transporter,substrate-binding protein n=4 Tax=Clavibacter nebraskensis TaxID=31963 RepID=A0AAI8ZFT5_9MICO|nr:ABC transporter substrate-binding protein [Clavibacter nebraskensis]UQB05181.1 ABC transporter substrate-binding protein [Clavibacter nebraskensis]UQB08003.1 ABC transporter substrate-binding protein [Clavibacter nebraskensis]UQB10837.1 ABC transporter substrate-binding protein [Clavibacter nebraskensis]UQB13671.1 ABC transporter substrate-binding protein [Clavibacter nebraskensis]CCE74150.1 putative peptide ABC transporter,substrate-binding protein [Clavibacter nebraskensis NCPPB 2581]
MPSIVTTRTTLAGASARTLRIADRPERPRTPSRRAVLSGTAGIAGLGLLALTGCSTGASSTTIPAAAATGTPLRGGRLRVARPAASAAETLDAASSLSAYEYLGALYNRLVKLDEKGETIPDLAEEWSASADGVTWTFRLRRGVRFHDGTRFTADDAIASIQHVLDPATASPQGGVLGDMLDPGSMSAPDPHTLVFQLKTPNAEFPSLLTAYQCYMVPAAAIGTIGSTGIGTGPFRLSSFHPAGSGSVEAFEDHFAGRPVLDGIDFSSIQDTTARVNALLAGQIDLISQTNLDFATARVVSASSRATVARVENAQWYTIPMLATSAEFQDPLVRQAMKLAYDPEQILATALQGTGTAGWDNPVPLSLAAFRDVDRAYDPDQAKALLAKAGVPGLRTTIHTSSYESVFTPMAVAYRDQVKAAGIDLTVTNASSDSYYTEIWMQKPLLVSYWFTGRPIDQLLNQIFRTGSSYNESAWSNPTFDALLDDARATMDDAKRLMLYQDAQRIVVEDSADMTPMFGDRLVGISRDVVNYREYGFEFDHLQIGFRR